MDWHDFFILVQYFFNLLLYDCLREALEGKFSIIMRFYSKGACTTRSL